MSLCTRDVTTLITLVWICVIFRYKKCILHWKISSLGTSVMYKWNTTTTKYWYKAPVQRICTSLQKESAVNSATIFLTKDEDTGTGCCRQSTCTEPTALLWGEPGVWADRNASGPGASVGGTSGGGGHRRVPLRDQAEPVHPRPCTKNILLWDAIRGGHRRGRMLQVQGLPRCVYERPTSTTINQTENTKYLFKKKNGLIPCRKPF